MLARAGHTEAAVDLTRLAGLTAAGVIGEVVHDDGTLMRAPALREFADEHGLALVSIEDLQVYRRLHESQVERLAETRLPTEFGEFTALGYRDVIDGAEHIALVHGDAGHDRVPGAAALRVPHRRRPRVAAVRLRPAAAGVDGRDHRRGRRHRRVPARSRGPRHRPAQQAEGVRAPGRRPRHRGRQPRPRVRRGRARLRRGSPDPARPRRHLGAAADQQPRQGDRPGGLRRQGGRAAAAARGADDRQPEVPADQGPPHGPRPARAGPRPTEDDA